MNDGASQQLHDIKHEEGNAEFLVGIIQTHPLLSSTALIPSAIPATISGPLSTACTTACPANQCVMKVLVHHAMSTPRGGQPEEADSAEDTVVDDHHTALAPGAACAGDRARGVTYY